MEVIQNEFNRLVAAHQDCVGVQAEMTPHVTPGASGGGRWRSQIVVRVLGNTPVPCQKAFEGMVRQLQSKYDLAT
jgi:hypothetical protein